MRTLTSSTDVWGEWPDVERRLLRRLRRHGSASAEDLVQDVAERLVVRGDEPFESAEHLYRWALRVAENRAIDVARKEQRVAASPVLDRADIDPAASPEMVVEQRVEEARISMALQTLSAEDRAVLLGAATADDPAARNRLNVRRYRARARLAQALGKTLGIAVGVAHSVRRSARVATVGVGVAVAAVAISTVGPSVHPSAAPLPARGSSVVDRAVTPARLAAPQGTPSGAAGSGALSAPATHPRPDRGTSRGPGLSALPVVLERREVPDQGPGSDPPTLCVVGVPGVGCVDRPGPNVDDLVAALVP